VDLELTYLSPMLYNMVERITLTNLIPRQVHVLKRETGANPVRSRHCKRRSSCPQATGKPGRRAGVAVSQETCRRGVETYFTRMKEVEHMCAARVTPPT
jgi:hypothetical protein